MLYFHNDTEYCGIESNNILVYVGTYVYIVKLIMCDTALEAAGACKYKAIYLILCGV